MTIEVVDPLPKYAPLHNQARLPISG